MLPLTLLLCLAPGEALDFDRITPDQAKTLAGEVIRVRCQVLDPDPEHASCHSGDGNLRAIIWRPGEGNLDEGPVTVEGKVRLVFFPSYVIHGEKVRAFFQIRLEEARPVEE